jgi:hypothetical protein
MTAKELESAANSIWRNQEMSTNSVATALLDLIIKYANQDGLVDTEPPWWRAYLAWGTIRFCFAGAFKKACDRDIARILGITKGDVQ